MTSNGPRRVSRYREYNPYAELTSANHILIEKARREDPRCYWELMSCILVSAIRFEALMNVVGARQIPDWASIEKNESPEKKLKRILHKFGMSVDMGCRPYQTIRVLVKFRNDLVHSKPESLIQEDRTESGDLEEMRRRKPEVGWEAKCSIGFAEIACHDVEQIASSLCDQMGIEHRELLHRGHGYSISHNPE